MISLVFLGLFALTAAAPQYQPFQYNRVASPDSSVSPNNDDGQYHPDPSGAYIHSDNPYKNQGIAAVKYNGNVARYTGEYDNSGQYKSDNSGAYSNNDGQYHPDNTGAYNPDDAGRYIHSDDSYKHQGGAYVESNTGGLPVSVYKPVVPRPVAISSLKENTATYNNNNKNDGIIRKIEQVLEDGYHYIYETENGILAEEEGHLENKGQQDEYMDVKGFYKYIGTDNLEYKVEYTVDAVNGFVPRGDHIPQVANVSS